MLCVAFMCPVMFVKSEFDGSGGAPCVDHGQLGTPVLIN